MSEPAPIYLGMRAQFLATRRADLTCASDGPVFAMLFEVTNQGAVMTLAASAAGDASFYTSQGGGAIGGIGVPELRAKAVALVALAGEIQARALPVAGVPPLPAAGEINVILLTDAGCKELRTSSAVKVAPDDPLVRIIRDAGALLQGLLSRRPATGA